MVWHFLKELVTRNWFHSSSDQDEVAELMRLGRDHFANDFPNANREGCPPASTLKEVALAPNLPDEKIRAHLLTCSECYKEFQEELARSREFASQGAFKEGTRRAPRIPVLVGAAVALLLVLPLIVLFMVYRQSHSPENLETNTTPSQAQPTPTSYSQAGPSPDSSASPDNSGAAMSSAHEKPSRPTIIAHKASIDLQTYITLRNLPRASQRTVELASTHNQISIRLPSNSPPGRYQLVLKNPAAESVRSTRATSADGVQLDANLNLTSVKPGNYMICITRKDEIPECVPAIVK